ncbi:hypothetical protein [Aporhodopirellula aestuarii]|uniref:Uncharacterized protein n=1 Tax=Aporhodopirellula aestuarii TaxID=2950107 RepID=A0ABT0UC52_9BACT|nr:hypothetical protein [Aporhodopirellula aestuarii]MCM2374490.1 hypothetical protein [Aporhodopirellula aestuarii]
MKRYGIALLLLLTALAGVAFSPGRPCQQQLTAFNVVDLDTRHTHSKKAKHYELTIANTGSNRVWVPDNDTPFFDVTFNLDPGSKCYTFANGIFDDRTAVQLKPGDGLAYDLDATARFREIDFSLPVRDRRGREAHFEHRLKFVGGLIHSDRNWPSSNLCQSVAQQSVGWHRLTQTRCAVDHPMA